MIHFGDITKLSGYTLPVVDIVTGGSPCQDLSVAGKRAGLAGERSGLFMEQIRIVKEMREHDQRTGRAGFLVRPRYMVWENVPGAFSSNKGADFQAVLSEIVKVAEPDAPDVPLPDKGKWPKAGCLYSDVGAWSIAWRLHDAQFWGVPQRRKRIALVADFGGLAAPEILFERKGVSGDSEPSGEKGQGTARSTEDGSGTAGKCLNSWDVQSKHIQTPDGVAESLYAGECRYGGGESYVLDDAEPIMLQSNQNNARVWNNGVCGTLPAAMGMGGGYVPMITEKAISFQERAGKPGDGKGILIQDERTGALSTLNNQNVFCLNDQGGSVMGVSEDVTGALRAEEHGHQPVVVDGVLPFDTTQITSRINRSNPHYGDPCHTLAAGAEPPAIAFAQNQRDEVRDLGDVAGSLAAEPGMKQQTFVFDARGNGDGEIAPTMTGDHQNRVTDYTALCVGNGQLNQMSMSEQANTLDTMHDQQAVLTFDKEMYNCGQKMTGEPQARYDTVAPTVRADTHPSGVCQSVVRRLTPLECERLQGFPDGWTDIGEWVDSKGKKHKEADSPRYKALGNSIALPFWQWMARRICAQYERTATMGSLFDGIGGFPLVFERAGAKAVWASEIEEFPIAVTKKHFPEGEGS